MLNVLSLLPLAQIVVPVPPVPTPAPSQINSPPPLQAPALQNSTLQAPPRALDVVRPQQVRPLPGELDKVPVFNSNSPELIQTEGIIVSTFPPDGMQSPTAHLNYAFQGRFDVFAHHVARGQTPDDVRTLYLGIIVYNPSDQPVTLDILQAASYLSQDAPFLDLPAYVANPMGTVYAGPGSRTTNDILRGERQPQWPAHITIGPKQYQLLVNVPIPLRRLTVATDGSLPPGYLIPLPPAPPKATPVSTGASDIPSNTLASPSGNGSPTSNPPVPDNRPLPINGRSIMMQLSSSGRVYMASLAMYAPRTENGFERVPTLPEWETLLHYGDLAGPRDRPPTPLNARAYLRFFYGRVAGVAQGAQWSATASDSPNSRDLSIPKPGEAVSYVLSTLDHNTFGTGQIQSAPMLVRYPDTAYRAHGNYGIRYNITLPLHNTTNTTQRVAVMIQTPLQDEHLRNALRFREPPAEQVFFRGTVQLRYTDDFGIPQTRYLHIIQRRGQEGEPLIRLTMPQGDRRLVEVQFIYPPDATPPQVLTVQTEENGNAIQASK